MLRSVMTVGLWTMGSRVLGFARDILIAALLGTGPVADAFFVALKLPNLFRKLFGEGAFNAAFVPAFAGTLAAEGPAHARRLAEEVCSVLLAVLAIFTLFGVVFMPQLMVVLAPGFEDIPAKFALTVALSRITFPYLLLICMAALLSGVLNGLNRFAAAAAAPILFNVFAIAAMLWLTPFVPTVGHALSWGLTVSGMAQMALVAWACARAGMPLRLPRPRLTPAVRLVMRRMAPGLIGAGVTQINLAVDVIIASLLPPGTVSVLYYADRVNQLPLGVIGAAVGTALLPVLSRQMRAGDDAAARATLNRAIEFAVVLTLPAALALAVVAEPIMRALFGYGAFSMTSVHESAAALAAYAFGLPAFVLLKVLAPPFFARGDTASPVWVGVVAMVLNIVFNLLLMGPLGQVGVALATSLAGIINAAALIVLLVRHGDLRLDARLRTTLPRMVFAGLAMAGALWLAERALAGTPRLIDLAVLIALGLGVYGLIGHAIGAFNLAELRAMVLRRKQQAIP
ncbi:MAG TPA: murein biosynthesis integral membrane protein MurJ [Acetobacteraceae bacterium]|nr:murein biosynthesis integral membrane protein MurJ [Acetobacteraceae bacterium]